MATKNTFLCYYDWIHYADEMTNEELGMLFRKILQHENQTEEIELPSDFKFIRWKIKASLDENSKKWNDKIEETRKRRSEAWSNHEWNQYTRQREKRKEHKQAKKPPMEQMEQMEQNGTNGTNGTCLIHTLYNNSSTTSSKKEKKNIRKEEMLEAFRKDTRLTPYMEEGYVCKRWDFKEEMKQPYKDVSSFMTMLVRIKNNIAKSWGMPKSDRNRRNRFAFMVDTAIEKKREWLHWYDWMEQEYLDSKDDLYPTPKQNE